MMICNVNTNLIQINSTKLAKKVCVVNSEYWLNPFFQDVYYDEQI